MTNRFFWKLVFQSGRLAGQFLHLPAGELTVGGLPQSDIHLPDADTYNEHCLLRVDDHRVNLQPLRVRCKVDGRRVRRKEISLRAGQLVEVGGCKFAIERADSTDNHVEIAAPTTSQRRIRLSAIALPGGVMGIGLLVIGLWIGTGQRLQASALSNAPVASFNLASYQQALQKEAGLAQVKMAQDKTGMLTLSGLCRNRNDLTRFLDRLLDAGVVYQNQVVCEDELRRNVAYILRANGYHDARVSRGKMPGSVVIAGSIRADEHWLAVNEQLDQLRGLRSWTVSNDTDAMIADLVKVLRESGSLAKLSVMRQGEMLTVTGQLPKARRRTIQQILDTWQQRYNGRIHVVYQDIPVSKLALDIFPAPVTGLSGNDQAVFLQLADGTKVQAGSALPSGYWVSKLNRNGIELRKEGQLVHLPLELWE